MNNAISVTIARAFSSSDLGEKHFESDADRITAAAFSDPLGVLLQKVYAGNMPGAYQEALESLKKRIRNHSQRKAWKNASWDKLDRLASICLLEFILDVCPRCQGRGILTNAYTTDGVLEQEPCNCDAGKVHGKAGERCVAMRIDMEEYGAWKPRFDDLLNIMRESYSRASGQEIKRLDRNNP